MVVWGLSLSLSILLSPLLLFGKNGPQKDINEKGEAERESLSESHASQPSSEGSTPCPWMTGGRQADQVQTQGPQGPAHTW